MSVSCLCVCVRLCLSVPSDAFFQRYFSVGQTLWEWWLCSPPCSEPFHTTLLTQYYSDITSQNCWQPSTLPYLTKLISPNFITSLHRPYLNTLLVTHYVDCIFLHYWYNTTLKVNYKIVCRIKLNNIVYLFSFFFG